MSIRYAYRSARVFRGQGRVMSALTAILWKLACWIA